MSECQITSTDEKVIKYQNFNKQYRPTSKSPESFPFTDFWEPGLPGSYVINAIGSDSSKNYISSQISIVSSTTGSTPPTINMIAPNEVATATPLPNPNPENYRIDYS